MKTHILFYTSLVLMLFLTATVSFSQGNVGIGTLTPANRLDIRGDAASTADVLNVQSTFVGNSNVVGIKGTSLPAIGFGTGGYFQGGNIGAQGYVNNTFAGFTYGLNGFAGGTGGFRFGVYGSAGGGVGNYGLYGIAEGGTGHFAVFGHNPNVAGYAGYFNGRGYFDNDLFAMNRIGLNTLTPTTRLQIIGGQDCGLFSNTNGFIQCGASGSWNVIIDDNEILGRNNGLGNDLFIQNDDGNILLCAAKAGAVGVGLGSGNLLATGYLFSVDGKIIAEEMRIQNSANWPDYVFDQQYELMPLEDLKKSIAANKHLPNIPSATDVAENGIIVGEMQKKMMEKIEELTLYVIELHEQNQKQQREIEELKSVIKNQ